MKTRWLAILACLLVTACSQSKPEKPGGEAGGGSTAKATAPGEDAKPATKPADTKAEPGEDKTSMKPADEVDPSKTAEPAPLIRADQLAAIEANYTSAMAAFRQTYGAAPAADKQKLYDEFLGKVNQMGADALKLAEAEPGDETARKALVWLVGNTNDAKLSATAISMLVENHADSEELSGVCSSLARSGQSKEIEDTLAMIVEKSPHDSVKAAGTMALASYLTNVAQLQEYAAKNPAMEIPEYVKNFVADEARIEGLYETLVNDYADVDAGRGTYGETAAIALFEMRNLVVGKVAPDIVANDLDGVEFKLSDYRGKIVVLDFWGDW